MPYSDPEKRREAQRRWRAKQQAGTDPKAEAYRKANRRRNAVWRDAEKGDVRITAAELRELRALLEAGDCAAVLAMLKRL